jgi:hypothetical protein
LVYDRMRRVANFAKFAVCSTCDGREFGGQLSSMKEIVIDPRSSSLTCGPKTGSSLPLRDRQVP